MPGNWVPSSFSAGTYTRSIIAIDELRTSSPSSVIDTTRKCSSLYLASGTWKRTCIAWLSRRSSLHA
eukprot:537037-Rhodomonas_salina.1